MKKTLLFGLTSLVLSLSVKAQYPQCDPANRPTGTDFPTDPDSMWIYPDELPAGNVGASYYEVIYIKFPEHITTEFSGTVLTLTFDSAKVNSVTGMPSGFSKKSDKYPNPDVWTGGEYGCVAVYGTTNTYGTYNPVINTTVYVTLPPPLNVQQAVDTPFSNFTLFIDGAVGIADVKTIQGNLIYPNPANNNVFVNFTSNSNSNMLITLTNLLGEAVLTKKFSVAQGANKFELNTSDLAEGIYVYTLLQDGKKTTGKLTVTH